LCPFKKSIRFNPFFPSASAVRGSLPILCENAAVISFCDSYDSILNSFWLTVVRSRVYSCERTSKIVTKCVVDLQIISRVHGKCEHLSWRYGVGGLVAGSKRAALEIRVGGEVLVVTASYGTDRSKKSLGL